jgi:hypothetical protein
VNGSDFDWVKSGRIPSASKMILTWLHSTYDSSVKLKQEEREREFRNLGAGVVETSDFLKDNQQDKGIKKESVSQPRFQIQRIPTFRVSTSPGRDWTLFGIRSEREREMRESRWMESTWSAQSLCVVRSVQTNQNCRSSDVLVEYNSLVKTPLASQQNVYANI